MLTDDAKVMLFAGAVLLTALTLVGLQVHAQMACEAEGGIPVRAFSLPSFTDCVR